MLMKVKNEATYMSIEARAYKIKTKGTLNPIKIKFRFSSKLQYFELMKNRILHMTISHLNGTVTIANVVKNGAQGYSQYDIDR